MAEELIARRYSRTLVVLGKTVDKLETWRQELRSVQDVIDELPRLSRLVRNPAVPASVRRKLITKGFRDQIDPLLHRFLLGVVDRRRLYLLPVIIEELRLAIDEIRGHHPAEITSALSLSDSLQQAIVKRLENTTGYTLDARFHVDPEIIGGLHIRIDDVAVDGRFSRILRELAGRLDDNQLLMASAANGRRDPS